jgi:nucleotide-binding universal stress UspA family protein
MAQAAGSHFHPQQILVPVDFSASSVEALQAAEDLAAHYGAAIELLHVVPMFPVVTGLEIPTRFFPEEEYLRESVRRAGERLEVLALGVKTRGILARWSVETGDDVIGNVLLVVERDKIDMVVLSTHGMTGWRPSVFGSIAEKILKLAPCPVLLLRTPRTIALTDGCVDAEAEVVAA